MNSFFYRNRLVQKYGNLCKINKHAVELMREEADDRSSFDVTTGHVDGVRNMYFIKIGYIST